MAKDKVKNQKKQLPVHNLGSSGFPVLVREIEHKNPYDFTQEHRHDYFEVFMFEKGGGHQLIDFNVFPVKDKSVYIVCPRQIHLLKRHADASGTLVQFTDGIISNDLKNALWHFTFEPNAAIIFEKDPEKMERLLTMITLVKQTIPGTSSKNHEIASHLLEAFLWQLMEYRQTIPAGGLPTGKKMLNEFHQLIEEQFLKNRSVKKYAEQLGTTERKLSEVTNQYLGLNPLQVIHNRLLLEAKRMLVFDETSHKEIAYSLNFDSPSTFSKFIVSKTSLSPRELQHHLANLHIAGSF